MFLESVSKQWWRNQHNGRMKRCQAVLGMASHSLFLTHFPACSEQRAGDEEGLHSSAGRQLPGISGSGQQNNIQRRTGPCGARVLTLDEDLEVPGYQPQL